MIHRINRDVFLTATLLHTGVPPALQALWRTVTLYWQSQRPSDVMRKDARVCVVLDQDKNTLTFSCDVLGDEHLLKLVYGPNLHQFSVLGTLLGWWLIEVEQGAKAQPDTTLLPADLRPLILVAV